MNCKQGDMAVIATTCGQPEYERYLGRIVRCLSLCEFTREHWLVTPHIDGYDFVIDKMLRPIRPSEGNDATLAWAGKPLKVVGPLVGLQ